MTERLAQAHDTGDNANGNQGDEDKGPEECSGGDQSSQLAEATGQFVAEAASVTLGSSLYDKRERIE